MPDAKRGLTISISWDIKKESVLRRETVCPPKGRRERLPWSAQRGIHVVQLRRQFFSYRWV